MRLILSASLALSALSVPTLAPAQERVLTIFGSDKCPDNTICVTAPEADRFRIPKELRGASTNPQNQSWATRSRATLDTGNTSPTSCTSASNQGWSGCWVQQMRQAREDAKAREAASDAAP
jgi:hypothetical protein